MVERVEELIPESDWRRGYRDIADFERTIADDGHQIIKFFLHISKQEQKQRYDKLIKDPLTAWHVTAEDWEHHRRYDDWSLAYEEAFERTDTEWGPWTIVEATDRRYTWVKIYQTIIQSLEERLGIQGEPIADLLAEQPQAGEMVETEEPVESEEEETLEEEVIRKLESVVSEESLSTEAVQAEWAVSEETYADPQAAGARAGQMVESGENQD